MDEMGEIFMLFLSSLNFRKFPNATHRDFGILSQCENSKQRTKTAATLGLQSRAGESQMHLSWTPHKKIATRRKLSQNAYRDEGGRISMNEMLQDSPEIEIFLYVFKKIELHLGDDADAKEQQSE